MIKHLLFAIVIMSVVGESVGAQEQIAPGRKTPQVESYYRLNSVPASEMNAASEYIEEMLKQLYEKEPRTWNNFRNKQYLLRSNTPVQGELEFYREPVETFRDELAVILDYIYLFHQVNQNPSSSGDQELKRALINKIDNKFQDIYHYTVQNYYFRSYGTDPCIQILKIFAQTLQESVTIFIPPFSLRDANLRNAIITGLSKVYRQLLSVEVLGNKDPQEKALRAQHRKDVDMQIQLISKYFTPPGLWARTKVKIQNLLFAKSEPVEPTVMTCSGLFGGSI